MRTAFLSLCTLAIVQASFSHSQDSPALQRRMLTGAIAPGNQQDEMVDIELFVDSLLSQKDIVFSDKIIEAGQVWLWNKKWGSRVKEPHCVEFGKKTYKLKNGRIVFGYDNLKEGVFNIDTAMQFSINGKEFYLASGGYYNCNGSGCGTSVYFLVDKKRGRLHLFQMFRQSATKFLGDINNDGQLDLVIQDYIHTPGHDEKPAALALYPYTLNSKGYFERMKNIDGAECFLIGIGDDQWYPANFRIVGYNCLSFEIKRN
jgi:hypothetical protein